MRYSRTDREPKEKSRYKKSDRTSRRYTNENEGSGIKILNPHPPRKRNIKSDDNRFSSNESHMPPKKILTIDNERDPDTKIFKKRTTERDFSTEKNSRGRRDRNSFNRSEGKKYSSEKYSENENKGLELKKPYRSFREKNNYNRKSIPSDDGLIRLNKYIANTGICSRREADRLISTGAIKVNGEIITELGYKIKPTDTVHYGGEKLKTDKLVYILLNKPKDYITTSDDPEGRKTVMQLIDGACKERVYPVGRLDRNTLGLLLLTNDGELTKRLTHPSFGAKKIYHVSLNKALTKRDMLKIIDGLELEDGLVSVDKIEYVGDGEDKKEIGVEIHSGKNRIIRRIFESLGYEIKKLDRVYFAGLTKKNLPRGKYRFLDESEINMLRMTRKI